MDSSDLSISDMLTCPSCNLRHAFKVSSACRRCGRPLPVTCLELGNRSIFCKSDLSGAQPMPNFIGNTIRRLRLRRGYTQSTLALAVGTHRTHVSRIETGRVAPTAELLMRAANALGVVRILLCINTKKPKPPGVASD